MGACSSLPRLCQGGANRPGTRIYEPRAWPVGVCERRHAELDSGGQATAECVHRIVPRQVRRRMPYRALVHSPCSRSGCHRAMASGPQRESDSRSSQRAGGGRIRPTIGDFKQADLTRYAEKPALDWVQKTQADHGAAQRRWPPRLSEKHAQPLADPPRRRHRRTSAASLSTRRRWIDGNLPAGGLHRVLTIALTRTTNPP